MITLKSKEDKINLLRLNEVVNNYLFGLIAQFKHKRKKKICLNYTTKSQGLLICF